MSVGLASVLGDDEPGQSLIRELEDSGVDCRMCLRCDGGITGIYLAIENEIGALVGAVAQTDLLDRHAAKLVSAIETHSKPLNPMPIIE